MYRQDFYGGYQPYQSTYPNFQPMNNQPYMYGESNILGQDGSAALEGELIPPFQIDVPDSPLIESPNYSQGFLRQLIGKFLKVDFLLGTNQLVTQSGELTDVGVSYIVLYNPATGENIMGDIYSIKFATYQA